MKQTMLMLSLLISTSPLIAAESVLKLGGVLYTRHDVVEYKCDNKSSLAVDYWNSDDGQGVAILPVNDKPRLFVSVQSGSGARYQSMQWTWWSKGDAANLYDGTHGEKESGYNVYGNCKLKH